MSKVRILVVEDFAAFREFVCAILAKNLDLLVVGEAADGIDAVKKAQELKPDLILLDIGLPSQNGLEAARQICELSLESRIIFVTQESSPDVVKEAFGLGAQGYVLKTHAGTDLLAAVDAVILGKQFVSAI